MQQPVLKYLTLLVFLLRKMTVEKFPKQGFIFYCMARGILLVIETCLMSITNEHLTLP